MTGGAPAQGQARVLFVIGGGRSAADQLNRPAGVAVDAATGEIYIADTGNDRLLIVGPVGEYRAEIKVWGDLRAPTTVAVGPDEIYLAGSEARYIGVLDMRGRLKERIDPDPAGSGGIVVGRIVTAGNRLYAIDRSTDRVIAVNLETRRVLTAFGGRGSTDGQFAGLADVAVAPNGDIYALDMMRASVSVFDPHGHFIRRFGEAGGSFGQLALPTGLAVDASGRTLVVDATRHTLLLYDSDGRFAREFGGLGKTPGWFYFPRDVEVDAGGRVYVVEPFLNRVQVLATPP
ncbi:MAG: hypothetical protein QN176_14340 [Armatimonadota bacterium]|nr:hypothetical protein [Armatimonadota bacterium]